MIGRCPRVAATVLLGACAAQGPLPAADFDADDDGLSDDEERALGSDPNAIDTDGDGYTDRDEVFEGHDPTDPEDRIYVGRWPYFFEKDDLVGVMTGDAEPGHLVPRFELTDQFGEVVDLYDFHGTPVVIDLCVPWLLLCWELSDWVRGEPDSYFRHEQHWPAGPAVIERGDVRWVTVLAQGITGDPAVADDVASWHAEFPATNVPVLADQDYEVVDFVRLTAFPTLLVLEADLTVATKPEDDRYTAVLRLLAERFPE